MSRRVRGRWIAVILLLAAFSAAGCGYTTRAVILPYKTIHVPQFANRIDITRDADRGDRYQLYKPQLETEITRSVAEKFLLDGNLKPAREEASDVTLKGELIEFRREPLRYDDNDEVTEYRILIRINLSLINNATEETLWEENGFTGTSSYFPATSTLPNVSKKSDDQAVVDAVKDLARRIVERTVEDW